MKPAVTFFVRSFPVLSQTFVIDQIKGLIKQGHDVSVVALYEPKSKRDDWDEVVSKLRDHTVYIHSTYKMPVGRPSTLLKLAWELLNALFSPKKWHLLRLSFRMCLFRDFVEAHRFAHLANHVREFEPREAVIAHFGDAGVVCDMLMKQFSASARQFTVFHGHEVSVTRTVMRWKKFYRELAEGSKLVLPISRLWKRRLIEFGASEDRALVHRMGIDPKKFQFEPQPISSPLRILTVARATEKKGLEYAIRGVAKCKVPVTYRLIGDGPLTPMLRELVSELGAAEFIKLEGAKTHGQVAEALKEADVFLLPSITDATGDMEGVPVSLMEAMASGTLCLATEHSGIPELIESGREGLLVPEKNPDEIALALESIASGRVNADELRQAALKKVLSEFCLESLNESLSDLITSNSVK